MKPNAIPSQAPPVVETCPWCAGDLIVAEAMVACAACEIELPIAIEPPLAVAA